MTTRQQVALGVVIALVGHGLAFLGGFVAAQLVEPGEGGGFADLAAVAVTFLLVEAVLAVACVVAAIILRRRGPLAGGILAGWVAGVAAIGVALWAS